MYRASGPEYRCSQAVPLCFDQCLAPACRAAVEVIGLRGTAIEGVHDGFAGNGHLVNGAVAEIDHLLGMADRECTAPG